MRASSPVSAATATRKKVVECCPRGHVGHGTGARQEACERALAYRLTDAKPITHARLPRTRQKCFVPMISSKRICAYHRNAVPRGAHQSCLAFWAPNATSQSPSQDSPKTHVTYLRSSYPIFSPLAYPVNGDGSPLFGCKRKTLLPGIRDDCLNLTPEYVQCNIDKIEAYIGDLTAYTSWVRSR